MSITARQPTPDPAIPLLVGREREQAGLRDALSAALAGRGSLVLIGGEAGIGKTTLAEWVCREATEQGALVLAGRCYDLSETPPYGPWRVAFARSPRGAALPTLPAATLPTEQDGEELPSQGAIFARVRDYLAALAARQPLVLLLDDLHWADLASLDLLRFLGRELTELPLVLLATYRADELTRRHPLYQLLPALVREARAARIDLHHLVADDLRALVRGRYALPDADEQRLVGYIGERAEGNPFYAGELLRTLEGARVLHPEGERWALGPLGQVGVPPLLRQVIDARADRLGEDARGMLAIAAAIGQAVPLDLWASVAEVGEEALLDPIERAIEAGLLLPAEDGAGVRFAHALIREALYEGTLPLRRRAWHRRAAEALTGMAAPDPDAVAHHFRQAGDPRAAEWLIRAGGRAQRAYAWLTAAERYEAALALLEQQGADVPLRAWLLHTLALLLRYTDRPRSIGLLAEAATVAEDGGRADPALAPAARFDRGHLLCISGDYATGLPALRAALPALEALPPERLATLPTAVVLSLRRGEAYHRGVLLEMLAGSGHLTEVAAAGVEDLAWGPATSVRALAALGWLQYWRGEPTLAARAFTTAAAAARAVGQYLEVVVRLRDLGYVLVAYRADDLPARAALTAEMAAVLPAARAADQALVATTFLDLLRLVEGTWAELALWGVTRLYSNTWYVVSLAELAWHQGDAAVARARVRALLPVGVATAPGTVSLFVGLRILRVSAGLALDARDLNEARSWLEAHDRWLAWSGAVLGQAEGQLGWASYHRTTGDLPAARHAAERALVAATAPRQPLALLAAHRLLGELDADARRHADAQTHLDAALALSGACAAPYERALTLLALAELSAATDDRPKATAALTEARSLLEPLEARPALARADTLAARLATSAASPSPPALPAGLSAREAEVLRLVAQGLSNAQVAARLFLSPRTVDQHLRSIYNKLGVASRSAATAFAIDHGLR